MDTINKLVSSLGFSKVIEGDCFGESESHKSNTHNPLAYLEVYKRQLVYIVVGLLALLLGFYVMYGDEADSMITSIIDNVNAWLGSLLLGNYLSSATEIKTAKSLDLPVVSDKLEIDESLLSPF